LGLIFGAQTTGYTSPACITSQNDAGGNLKWILITVDGVTMYGQFLETAIVDGKQRNISFSLLADNSVSALLPHFWVSSGMFHMPS